MSNSGNQSVELPSATPAMLDIDLSDRQGRALLAAMAQEFGAPLAVAAHRLHRLFLLRSPWAPGLRFAGGQVVQDGGPDALCDRRVFSQSGPAETLEAAIASCVGEAVEVLSQIERPGDVVRTAPLHEVAGELMPSLKSQIEAQLATGGYPVSTPLDWMPGRALTTGRDLLVPADWCLRRAPLRMRLQLPWSLGSGVAAGPDWDWAASRALLELIERDAAALWWRGGRRGRPIALHDPALSEAARLAAVLRQDRTERLSWLLDITSDLGIPCVVAVSCDRDGRGLACGFGARPTLAAAVRSAMLENAQMELALLLARIRQNARDDRGAVTNAEPEEGKVLQLAALIDVGACDLLHPHGVPRCHAALEPGDAVRHAAAALEAAGIEAALVELTRPEFGLPVVRAIAPQLQPMPSPIVTPRLQSAVTETGGGQRFTHNLPLF